MNPCLHLERVVSWATRRWDRIRRSMVPGPPGREVSADPRRGKKPTIMIGFRHRTRSRAGFSTLVVAIYLIVGAFVAASHHYFSHVGGAKGIVSAVLAIALWPLVLIGLHIHL